jgi:hypothetical protein
LPARPQFVDAAERGDHLLTNLVAFAPAFDDLQIDTPA